MMPRTLFALYLLTAATTAAHAAPPLAAADVFELQWASDPQIPRTDARWLTFTSAATR